VAVIESGMYRLYHFAFSAGRLSLEDKSDREWEEGRHIWDECKETELY
jgi:hypothetical protein